MKEFKKLFVTSLLVGLVGCTSVSTVSDNSVASVSESSSEEATVSTSVNLDWDLPLSNVHAAKVANLGEHFRVQGVVAQFVINAGNLKHGFYIYDATDSLYVYLGKTFNYKIGQTVELVGAIEFYASSYESGDNAQIGYKGLRELVVTDSKLVNAEVQAIDFALFPTKRIKDIMTSKFEDEDLSTTIYHTSAYIEQDVNTGYTNYYFNDLSLDYSTYAYSANNGSDYSYLAQYHEQRRDVLIAVHSLKASNRVWRIVPIAIGEVVPAPTPAEEVSYALDRLATQFLDVYNAEASIPLLVEDTKLAGSVASYATNNEFNKIVIKENVPNLIIDAEHPGAVEVTITLVYSGITNTIKTNFTVDIINLGATTPINQILSGTPGQVVTVSGVYVRKAANVSGIYISDSTGIVRIEYDANFVLNLYNLGETLVFEGAIAENGGTNPAPNSVINAALVYHSNSTSAWDKSIVEAGLYSVDQLYTSPDRGTFNGKIFRANVRIGYNETAYASTYRIIDAVLSSYITLYSGSGSQLAWLSPYVGDTIYGAYVYARDLKGGSNPRWEVLDLVAPFAS
jgi:hypothetical protein